MWESQVMNLEDPNNTNHIDLPIEVDYFYCVNVSYFILFRLMMFN